MNKLGTRHAFWQALVFTIIVFGLGLVMGLFIEESRANEVQEMLLASELSFLDEQLRNRVVKDFGVGCDEAIDSTYEFADRIYWEAVKMEQYDSAHKFRDVLKLMHKRYDLLRMMMWTEAKELRKTCGDEFHTVAYIYSYDTEDVNQRAIQISLGKVLEDFKAKYGRDVLLIPMAGNLDLESIDLMKTKFDVSELPVVIIDEREVLNGLVTVEDLEEVTFG
jgi:hypothetical protein